MKILITSDWYAPVVNGVVTSVKNLELGLRQLGHEVRVLTLSGSIHSYRDGNVTYVASLSAGKVYPNARIRSAPAADYIAEIIAWKPDVVHSQCEFSTYFMAKKIAHKCRVPLVHTYHTVYEDYTQYFSPSERVGKKAAAIFSKVVLGPTDAVIVPSEKIAVLLRKYGVKTAIYSVPTGIDLSRYYPENNSEARLRIRKKYGISEDETVLVYVGRLAKEKNVEELFYMLKRCSNKTVRLFMVGDGPYRSRIEKCAAELGITDRLIFAGMVAPQEVSGYYCAGDIFVTASQSETQGLTYMEALASGLPLLCKDDPCLDDVIVPNENGMLFITPESFSEAVDRLLASSELRRQIGEAGLKTVREKFGVEKFAASAVEVYRDCQKLPKYQ